MGCTLPQGLSSGTLIVINKQGDQKVSLLTLPNKCFRINKLYITDTENQQANARPCQCHSLTATDLLYSSVQEHLHLSPLNKELPVLFE